MPDTQNSADTTELWKRVEFALDPVASFDSGAVDALDSLRTRMERMEQELEETINERDEARHNLEEALTYRNQEEAHA